MSDFVMAWQDREREFKLLRATQAHLGELCMVWATLDHMLDEILTELIDCGPNQTAIITSTIREVPPRCTMIERLLLTLDIDEDWRKWLSGVMALLRDDLGPQRNRYVHDRWTMDDGQMKRIDRQAKALKPQSHQKPQIQFNIEQIVPIEDLSHWCAIGHACALVLRDVIQDLGLWNVYRRAPTAHTQESAAYLAKLRE